MSFLILGVSVIMVAVLALCTKKGLAYLIWPIVMAYPHGLLYGTMPLNMGFDHLYIIATFLILRAKGYRAPSSWLTRMVWIYFGITALGDLVGLVMSPLDIYAFMFMAKSTLRAGIYVLFALIVLMAQEDEKDARRMFLGYIVGISLGCCTALMDYLGIEAANLFMLFKSEEEQLTHWRATGAFLSPDSVGQNVSMALLIGGLMAIFPTPRGIRILCLVLCPLLLITLMASASRTGLFGLGVIAILVLLFSRRRAFLAILAVIAILVAINVPGVREGIDKRWESTVQQSSEEGGIFQGSGRWGEMTRAWGLSFGPWTFVAGTGKYSLGGAFAHNGFLDILLVHGLAGVAWYAIFCTKLTRCLWFLKDHALTPFVRTLARGMGWSLLASIIFALSADPPLEQFWLYTFLWMAGTAVSLEQQVHAQASLAYDGALAEQAAIDLSPKPKVPVTT